MLKVACNVWYGNGEEYRRIINWDDPQHRREFARKSDLAIRDGGVVRTWRVIPSTPLGKVELD